MPELQAVETTGPQDTAFNPADLDDAALDEHIALDGGEPPDVPEDNSAETQEPEGEAAPEEASAEEQAPPEGTPEEPQPEEDTAPVAETDIEKLRKQVDDKESMIQRQAQEIGKLRKQPPPPQELELTAEEEEQVNNLYYESPVKAMALNQKLLQQKREAVATYQAEQNEQQMAETKEAVNGIVPNINEMTDDMVAVLRKEGTKEEHIESFRANPYQVHPGALINLAKRAQAEKKVAALEKENADLRQKLGDFPKKVKAATNSTILTGNIASTTKGDKAKLDESQLTKVSDAELEEFLKDNSD
jgi:hypothetical protein